MENEIGVKIRKLQHVGIPVTNMATTEAYYGRLGFKKVMQSAFDMDGEKGVCVMMELAEIVIEFYQLPYSKLAAIRERKNGHVDHVAFDVEDIDLTFALVQKAGLRIDEVAPVFLPFWKNGCKYFNVIGPDGERLEFNQIL